MVLVTLSEEQKKQISDLIKKFEGEKQDFYLWDKTVHMNNEIRVGEKISDTVFAFDRNTVNFLLSLFDCSTPEDFPDYFWDSAREVVIDTSLRHEEDRSFQKHMERMFKIIFF